MMAEQSPLQLYVGTYTRTEPHVVGKAEGIYHYTLDPQSGELTQRSTTPDIDNPSFLTVDAAGEYLYATSEIGDFGDRSGCLSAYKIGPEGELTLLNRVASGGIAPCHLRVAPDGKWLLAVNYGSGNSTILPIAADGSLGAATDLVQHEGSGPNQARQEGPHAHSVNPMPDSDYVLVADLGIDQVIVYAIDADEGKLIAQESASASLHPGAGPRHMDFHPDERLVFVINELDSTITSVRYNPTDGALTPLSTVSTLPAGFQAESTCADIHVHPNGRFLYGSNRGHDSIAVFEINAVDGALSAVEHVSTGGRTPRNFALSPDGRFLLAANQDTNTITVFSIDGETGRLTQVGQAAAPSPVCICWRHSG